MKFVAYIYPGGYTKVISREVLLVKNRDLAEFVTCAAALLITPDLPFHTSAQGAASLIWP